MKPIAVGNVVSTLIGIPVVWLILLVVEMLLGGLIVGNFEHYSIDVSDFWRNFFLVTIASAWMPPVGPKDEWLVFVAMGFILIPFFFASWFTEYRVVRNWVSKHLYNERLSDEDRESEDAFLGQITRESYFDEIRIAIRNANIVSYALLEIFLVCSLVITTSTR